MFYVYSTSNWTHVSCRTYGTKLRSHRKQMTEKSMTKNGESGQQEHLASPFLLGPRERVHDVD